MVCGGLRWFSRFFNGTRSYRRIIVPNSGGGLWWFAVVCGGLWWIAVVCLLVIPLFSASHSQVRRHTSYWLPQKSISQNCHSYLALMPTFRPYNLSMK